MVKEESDNSVRSHAEAQSPLRFLHLFFAPSAPLRDTFFLFLLFNFHLHAQQYSFKNYTVAHGLGSPSVNHIFQDSRGYIWFATQGGGASRFDGSKFESFTKASGLINNDVTFIAEDKNGNIWIGTAAGASRFNGTSFRSFSAKEGLTDGVVFSILADAQGKIWFATQDKGVKIFDGIAFDSLTTTSGLASNEVYAVVQDQGNNKWFGLSNGIAKYSDGAITSYFDSKDDNDENDSAFFSAMPDSSGTVWFGSTKGLALGIGSDSTIRRLRLPEPLQHDFIGGMAQDKRGSTWFATDHGLLKHDGKSFKLFSAREGLSVDLAQTVMCDYEGNIWCGTLDGGANLLSSEAFVRYAERDGLTARNVTCIFPGKEGNYYAGTGNGLHVFDASARPPFRKVSGIPEIENSNIISVSEDNLGLLWVCIQEGVIVLKKEKGLFHKINYLTHINGERIVSPAKIIHDKNGNCWLATYGSGLFLISGQTEKSINAAGGFPSDKLLALYEDINSSIWIGTQDAGMVKYDGKTFHVVRLPEGADKAVWSVAGDKKGNIYWGTGESGLFRHAGEELSSFTTRDGLSSNYITALQWDESENCLWVGSEKGLDRVTFGASGGIEKIRHYGEQEGFRRIGINHDALLIDQSGTLWLGTADRLWLFNPRDDLPGNVPPKIRLTDIRLFYQSVDWKKFTDSVDRFSLLPHRLELPYNKNHLTFDIQALTTQDAHYTFMLEGQDQTWSSPAGNNEITYSNITPGNEYIFKAKAINAGGVESSEAIAFSFAIAPPWWGAWWFRAAAFLTAILSLIAFIKAREKMLREQNIRLEETVKQRTSEIAHQKEVIENTLTEKEGLLHEKEILLKEIHHRVKNNLQTISSMLMLQSAGLKDDKAKAAIAESQSRVRSIALVHQKLYQTDGLEKVELNSFTNDLIAQVQSLYRTSQKAGISLDIPETLMLIDTAIPLGLILNELLTNSFKYAFNKLEKGEIRIKLENLNTTADPPRTKKVRLTYCDNGPGFDFARLSGEAATLGIRLVNLLSQQIGAAQEYSRSNGSEFIFTFELHV